MSSIVKIQARGVLTLPKKMRQHLNMSSGSLVEVKERDGGVFISAALSNISASDSVLADVKRSLEDFKKGEYIEFSSVKEFHTKRVKKWGGKQ